MRQGRRSGCSKPQVLSICECDFSTVFVSAVVRVSSLILVALELQLELQLSTSEGLCVGQSDRGASALASTCSCQPSFLCIHSD
jgi:hypothetical protein